MASFLLSFIHQQEAIMSSSIPRDPVPFKPQSFWQKLWRLASRAGRRFVEVCLLLYYAAQSPRLPVWEKLLIYSALLYFLTPMDAVSDFLPLGLTDDFTILSATLARVGNLIDHTIQARVARLLTEWFGTDLQSPEQGDNHASEL